MPLLGSELSYHQRSIISEIQFKFIHSDSHPKSNQMDFISIYAIVRPLHHFVVIVRFFPIRLVRLIVMSSPIYLIEDFLINLDQLALLIMLTGSIEQIDQHLLVSDHQQWSIPFWFQYSSSSLNLLASNFFRLQS